MKRAELETLGLEKEIVDKIMSINGADIEGKKKEIETLQEKLEDAKSKLTAANGQISDMSEKVSKLDEKDGKVAELQKQIDEFKQVEAKKAEESAKAQAEKELTEKICNVFGDKTFTSDYVKNGIINDIKAKLSEDNTIGIEKAFEELTKDKDGIFANPNKATTKIPPTGDTGDSPKEFPSFF